MKRGKREADLRVQGLELKARFGLTLTLALTPILAPACPIHVREIDIALH